MSQFTGGRRVRCADCLHLQGNRCIGRKNVPKISPKKKRACNVYEFKGEYCNPTPPESVYIPPVDPKTARLMKRLKKMGVGVVTEEQLRDAAERRFSIPHSTATAPLSAEMVGQKESLIWTPDSEDE